MASTVRALQDWTEPALIFPDLQALDGNQVLLQVAERLAAAGRVRRPKVLYQRLREREELGSTALGHGVAVPHCRLQGLSRLTVAIGRCADGVDFEAEDGEPVRLFFVVVSPDKAAAEHLQCLAAISRWVRNGRVDELLESGTAEEIYALLETSAGE